MTRFRSAVVGAAVAAALCGGALAAQGTQSQTPPPFVPKPFPQPSQPGTPPPASAKPAAPPVVQAPAPAPTSAPITATPPSAPASPLAQPTAADLHVQVYPNAEFLESLDAGRGQRYYLFGTNAPYADVVTFYKRALQTGGRELFKTPAMQQFDLPDVKFQDDTMAFVPSVVVKDYTWNGSQGYPFVSGTTEMRFRTVIQIVPPPAGIGR